MTMTIRLTRTIGFEDTNTIGYYHRTRKCIPPRKLRREIQYSPRHEFIYIYAE